MDRLQEESRILADRTVDQLRIAADLTLRHFVESLLNANGAGAITVGQVRDLAHAFEANEGEIEHICRSVAAAGAADRTAWGVDQDRRRDYLGRALVERFSTLLVRHELASAVPGCISRRIVPGFLHVVSTILGMDGLKPYREACAEVAARIEADVQFNEPYLALPGIATTPPFDWMALFEDPEVMDITDAVRMRIASLFDDFESRKAWFIEVVQETMASLAAAGGHAEVEPFGESEFEALMNEFYADLKARSGDLEGRAVLTARFGQAAVTDLDRLCRNLRSAD